MNMLDLLDKFNWMDRAQGLVWAMTTYLPHQRSHKGRKVGPYVIDGGVTEIHIDRAHSTGGEAERALARAHVPIAGRRVTSKEAIFLVRSRQAEWAEYVLLRAGVVLGPNHRMIDEANYSYAANKGPVPMWDEQDPTQRSATPQTTQPKQKRKRCGGWFGL